MVITVFGDFNSEEILKHLKHSFSNIKPLSTSSSLIPLPYVLHSAPQSFTVSIPQDVAAIFVGFDSARFEDKQDILKLDLLDAVLSGISYPSGRLHQILREKGLVYMTHAVNRLGIEPGHFMLCALTSADKLDTVHDIIFDQIQDVSNHLVSDQEFELALAQLKYYYKERISSLDQLSLISATDELYGLGYLYSKELNDLLIKLKKEDIQEMAKKYLKNPQVFIFKKQP
jgi:zinc protease